MNMKRFKEFYNHLKKEIDRVPCFAQNNCVLEKSFRHPECKRKNPAYINNNQLDCFGLRPHNDVTAGLFRLSAHNDAHNPLTTLKERVGRKVAFTLAEVLITLGVIGVVAAITLPTLFTNLNERINSERQANIAQKITRAMEQMRALGLLNQSYASTDAFVDELQRYLKITKRCDFSNIENCWPTTIVKTNDGTEYKVKRARTGKDINLDTTTNNVGLVLADGASLILNYNPDTPEIDTGDTVKSYSMTLPVGNNRSKDFAYSSNVTNSIDFIMDTNGKKGPNSEVKDTKWHDIRSFKGARFGGCGGVKIASIGCVVFLGSNFECISEPPFNNNDNCWAGARVACEKIGMELPNKNIVDSLWSIKSNYSYTSNFIAWFYSSEESGSKVYKVPYSRGPSFGGYGPKNYKKDVHAFCVSD